MEVAGLLTSLASGIVAALAAEAWCRSRRLRLEGDDADMLGVIARAQDGGERPEGYAKTVREWLALVSEQVGLCRVSPATVHELARRGLVGDGEVRSVEEGGYEGRYLLEGTLVPWCSLCVAASIASWALAGATAACCVSSAMACALADRTYRLVPLPGALAYAAFGVAATGADPVAALSLGLVAGACSWSLGRAWGPGAFGAGDAVMVAAALGMLTPSTRAMLAWCAALALELTAVLVRQRTSGGERSVALCPLLVAPTVLALWAQASGL